MLSAVISWTATFDLEWQVRLDVARTSGSAVADYRAVLTDERRNEQLAEVELKEYPRWSEPAAGLVARALHYCIADSTPRHLIAVHPVRTLIGRMTTMRTA